MDVKKETNHRIWCNVIYVMKSREWSKSYLQGVTLQHTQPKGQTVSAASPVTHIWTLTGIEFPPATAIQQSGCTFSPIFAATFAPSKERQWWWRRRGGRWWRKLGLLLLTFHKDGPGLCPLCSSVSCQQANWRQHFLFVLCHFGYLS